MTSAPPSQPLPSIELPFDFTVAGPPVSHQTKNKKRLREWKATVTQAAKKCINTPFSPTANEISFEATYFYEGDCLDADNMIKPIQDALVGLVYVDDSQIVDTKARKRKLDGAYRLKGITPALAMGFSTGTDFIHIVISEPPDMADL